MAMRVGVDYLDACKMRTEIVLNDGGRKPSDTKRCTIVHPGKSCPMLRRLNTLSRHANTSAVTCGVSRDDVQWEVRDHDTVEARGETGHPDQAP